MTVMGVRNGNCMLFRLTSPFYDETLSRAYVGSISYDSEPRLLTQVFSSAYGRLMICDSDNLCLAIRNEGMTGRAKAKLVGDTSVVLFELTEIGLL